jgi:hypothetical protein
MAQIILDSNNNLIQGDFDNATLNNRTKLQTTTTNATTNVYVVPNGSSTSAGVSVANNSSLTNASKIVMATNGTTDTQIISGVNGSGSYLPLSFYTNNALAAQISTAGVFSATGGIAASSMPTGSVLQVLQTVKTDTYSAAPGSSSWTDITGLSVSITPSSSSNKVMVFFSVHGSTSNLSYVRIVRDSTAIGVGETSGSRVSCTVGNFSQTGDTNRQFEWGTNFLDSPATTSSTTYKLQLLCETTNTFYLNRSAADQNNTVGFRPISQITVMEIKG